MVYLDVDTTSWEHRTILEVFPTLGVSIFITIFRFYATVGVMQQTHPVTLFDWYLTKVALVALVCRRLSAKSLGFPPCLWAPPLCRLAAAVSVCLTTRPLSRLDWPKLFKFISLNLFSKKTRWGAHLRRAPIIASLTFRLILSCWEPPGVCGDSSQPFFFFMHYTSGFQEL